MSPTIYLVAALACGAGALARFLLTRLSASWSLPWPTLIANSLGTAVLGAVAQLALTSTHPDALLLIVGAGFAGGLTTFSTLAVDAVALWRGERRGASAGYLVVTFGVGLACAALGWWLAGR